MEVGLGGLIHLSLTMFGEYAFCRTRRQAIVANQSNLISINRFLDLNGHKCRVYNWQAMLHNVFVFVLII